MVPPPDGPALAMRPIEDHTDFALVKQNGDRSLVGGRSVADLIADVKRAVALGDGNVGGNERAWALSRIAAMVRLDPAAAGVIADAIREAPTAEASVLAGGLGSSGVAAGTNALAELTGAELSAEGREIVVAMLSLSQPATPEDALIDAAIQRPELAVNAVRAVGYRDASQWRDRLAAAQILYAADNVIQSEIRSIMSNWA